MNPIIFFDELDKVSTTPHGQEITNVLMHLTDPVQNHHFQDRYFTGVDLDLSKATLIFSYNDIENLNPILRDRITEIQTKGFKNKEKFLLLDTLSGIRLLKQLINQILLLVMIHYYI